MLKYIIEAEDSNSRITLKSRQSDSGLQQSNSKQIRVSVDWNIVQQLL